MDWKEKLKKRDKLFVEMNGIMPKECEEKLIWRLFKEIGEALKREGMEHIGVTFDFKDREGGVRIYRFFVGIKGGKRCIDKTTPWDLIVLDEEDWKEYAGHVVQEYKELINTPARDARRWLRTAMSRYEKIAFYIRPSIHGDAFSSAWRREFLYPYIKEDGVWIYYKVEMNDQSRYILEEDLEHWGLDIQSLHAIAVSNMDVEIEKLTTSGNKKPIYKAAAVNCKTKATAIIDPAVKTLIKDMDYRVYIPDDLTCCYLLPKEISMNLQLDSLLEQNAIPESPGTVYVFTKEKTYKRLFRVGEHDQEEPDETTDAMMKVMQYYETAKPYIQLAMGLNMRKGKSFAYSCHNGFTVTYCAKIGNVIYPIYKNEPEAWGIDVETIHQAAVHNLQVMIQELKGENDDLDQGHFYRIENVNGVQGSAGLLSPEATKIMETERQIVYIPKTDDCCYMFPYRRGYFDGAYDMEQVLREHLQGNDRLRYDRGSGKFLCAKEENRLEFVSCWSKTEKA